jgi:hypothetical protein
MIVVAMLAGVGLTVIPFLLVLAWALWTGRVVIEVRPREVR